MKIKLFYIISLLMALITLYKAIFIELSFVEYMVNFSFSWIFFMMQEIIDLREQFKRYKEEKTNG